MQCRKVYIRYISRFFYPDLFFFPTIGARFCIFVPCIGFFLSVCGIQNVLKQIRVRKVLRPIFFASLSRFLCVLYSILVLCALFFCMSYSTFNLSTSPRSSVAVCLPVCCILNVTNVHILSRNVDDVCARAHSLAPGIYAYFAAIHSQNRFFPSNPVSLVRFEFKKYYSFVHIFCASCAYFIRCSSFTSYFESVACICLCSSVVFVYSILGTVACRCLKTGLHVCASFSMYVCVFVFGLEFFF